MTVSDDLLSGRDHTEAEERHKRQAAPPPATGEPLGHAPEHGPRDFPEAERRVFKRCWPVR